MGVTSKWRSGVATDAGLVRSSNEDRYWVDDENGIFLVVDGVGGQAAGDLAAELAVEVIREQLRASRGTAEERVRQAIVRANNEIYRQSRDSEGCAGMACVLTLAVVEEDQITIGHVGDSRLYLIWNGLIRKLTADHSPVGVDEDSGELTEEQARLHPRRNEVFREVGSRLRRPDDPEFVDIRHCRFKPDAAILLCSDGLSDLLPSASIREIVGHYAGDPGAVARELVEAANDAGGKDNVTALFVAGSEFVGRADDEAAQLRRATTRTRWRRVAQPKRSRLSLLKSRAACLVYGALLGLALWAVIQNARW